MYKRILVVVSLLLLSGCAHWNYEFNGVPLNKVENVPLAILGAAASVGVHTLGHVVFLESQDADWQMEGFNEVCYSPLTDNEGQWFGRAGFVSQLAVGTLLKLSPWDDTDFARGYHMGSFAEISTYPIIHRERQLGVGRIHRLFHFTDDCKQRGGR